MKTLLLFLLVTVSSLSHAAPNGVAELEMLLSRATKARIAGRFTEPSTPDRELVIVITRGVIQKPALLRELSKAVLGQRWSTYDAKLTEGMLSTKLAPGTFRILLVELTLPDKTTRMIKVFGGGDLICREERLVLTTREGVDWPVLQFLRAHKAEIDRFEERPDPNHSINVELPN